ncbi:MAG: helix-turn-helix transcriptional regulator [Acidimicrobiales bacterium]
MDDSLQVEAKALGDPTRHRIFRYVADAERPVTVAELTGHVGLNHNAVRQHLGILKEANLVVEQLERRNRPGRPRLMYLLHPEVSERWGTSGVYAWLGRLLSEGLRRHKEPREVGRDEGHRRASELSGPDAVDLLEAEAIRRGFRPSRLERRDRVDLVLGRCPFAEVASDDPDTICQLHLGLAEGLAEGLGGLKIERLISKSPRRGGCRLIVRRMPQQVPA